VQQVAVSRKLAIRATYLLTICALVLSVFYPITKAFAVTTSATYGCVIGSSSSCPGDSAWQIKQATGTNTNGLYWINVNGTATQVYAIMDSNMGGGGWMLAMKGATSSTAYTYGWTGWTNSGSYSGTQGTTNEDAKFNVFDYATANQVLTVWTGTTGNYCNNGSTISNSQCGVGAYGATITQSYGFTWAETLTSSALSAWTGASANVSPVAVCPSTFPITLLNLFKNSSRCLIRVVNAAYNASNSPYDPIGYHLFSSQKDVRFFGFNYGNSNNGVRARWGFGFNENGGSPADEGSNDTSGGIGLESISGGDRPTCCTQDSGGGQYGAGLSANTTTSMPYQVYVRNTSASLTTANPTFTSNAGTVGGATFTLDTSTVSADTITVTDSTNSGQTLTLIQNANGSYSVGGALSGDVINVSVNYVAKSGYQGTGTITLNITATSGGTSTSISIGSVNKLNNATITVTVSPSSALGTVNFYWNNRIINRCSSRTVTSGTATCTWKPMTQGQGVLTASFASSDGIYTNSSATPKYLVVGKRTGTR